jgi:hypothetical protein
MESARRFNNRTWSARARITAPSAESALLNFILSDSHLEDRRSLDPSALPKALFYTHQNKLSETHVSLDNSASLYYVSFPIQVFTQEVHVTICSFPQNVKNTLSPAFVDEWGAAVDRENARFIKHS